MKRVLTTIITLVFAFSPSLCFSAYRIYLKDGRGFVTERYWEEEGQIKFKRFGGVVGVRKELVQEIEEMEDLPEEKGKSVETDWPRGKEETREGGGPEGQVNGQAPKENGSEDKPQQDKNKGKEKKKGNAGKREIDVERYKKEKRTLLEKEQIALERYKRAGKFGDEATKTEAKRELKEIYKKLSNLASALRKENEGRLPPWWHQIVETQE